MRIKFFEQRYTWFVVGIPLVCGVIAIAWTVFHPKADKPPTDVPSTELFQHIPLPAPLSTSIVIKTQAQLDARDRLVKLLAEIDPLQTQGDNISKQLKELSEKVKACGSGSGEQCQSARADLLQAQSEGIRLGQKLDQLVKEIEANLCILDPTRSGC